MPPDGLVGTRRGILVASAPPADRPAVVVIDEPRHLTGRSAVLDTCFLAAPISSKRPLVQYVGRIVRAHPGKTSAEVHDYHDGQVGVLAASLARRAPGYAALGFPKPQP